MVDLVGIGVSGLAAYQRALATTSNNIANLQTEGYVRQRAVLETAGQDNLSRISLGNGVRFAEIQRLYDRFAEENLQGATSALKSEQSLLTELQSLQDSIGSSEAGLHGAFQAFFDSARELESAPASPGTRAGFLGAAEGLSARFRGLGDAVKTLDGTTRAQIEQGVGEVNSLLDELAQLNSELLKRGNDSEQPMQLLDRRDAALKSLSEHLGITVQPSNSGAVAVYAGDSASGAALVEKGSARKLSVNFNAYDYGKVDFVLDAASAPITLSNVRTGTMGGLASFRSQALGPTADKLDELALSFGRAVNDIHRQGLDSLGRRGQDLFYMGPDFSVSATANAGTARLGVEVADHAAVKSNSYQMSFAADKNLWSLRNLKTGASYELQQDLVKQTWAVRDVGANKVIYEGTALQVEGLQLSLQGAAKNGDTFFITPESHPSESFRTLITDGAEVATAGRMTSKAALANDGTESADIALTSGRVAAYTPRALQDLLLRSTLPGEQSFINTVAARSDTEVAASSTPIAVISAGMRRVALNTSAVGGELAIFTRDGRQISGPKMADSVVTAANGFFAGATYSDTYLNQSGASGYLDQIFARGPYQAAGEQVDIDGKRVLTPAMIFSDAVDVGSLPAGGSLNLQINGHAVTLNLGSPVTVQGLASQINLNKATTGAVAEATADGKLVFKSYQSISVPAAAIGDTPKITINGMEFSVSASALASVNTTRAAASLPALTGKEYLRDMINGSGIGVTASIASPSGDLQLTNSDGNAGKPIDIGENSVGLEAKTYFNNAPLMIDVPPTAGTDALQKLGLRSGFAMSEPVAEDLLVFGVSSQGLPAKVYLSGTYEQGDPAAALAPDSRSYTLTFDAGRYTLTDAATSTVVSSGIFDTTTRAISYGNWTVSLSGIPSDMDTFTLAPNDDPLGDNRIAAALSRMQSSRNIMDSGQTVQEEYENLVNRVGAKAVQAEVAKNAQQVVYDHAKESRDRVAGVNLDEELADLLRFQQAYQANAQVVQVANRLFDSLLQRL